MTTNFKEVDEMFKNPDWFYRSQLYFAEVAMRHYVKTGDKRLKELFDEFTNRAREVKLAGNLLV